MQFKIRQDVNIRARSLTTDKFVDYNNESIGRVVAYFIDKLNGLNYQEKIGVGFGNMSFLSACFMLALQKYNKEFTIVYHNDRDFEFKKTFCSHLFILGWFTDFENGKPVKSELEKLDKTQFTLIDTPKIEQEAINYHRCDNLIFDFHNDRKTYYVFRDKMSLLYPNGKIESGSIIAAMQNYIEETDVCILYRPFQHIGVATLSIYPTLFKAKNIIICSTRQDWDQEYGNATNIHMAKEMFSEDFPLPEKIRIITSGGYNFNSECVSFVTSRSRVNLIVDCFGTSQLPPPLAIRILTNPNVNSIWTPFKWIHDYITYDILDENSKLAFSTKDGDIFDYIENHKNGKLWSNDCFKPIGIKEFEFMGSEVDFIRMTHVQYNIADFIKTFNERSGIPGVKVEFEIIDGLKNPTVVVPAEYLEHANKMALQYHVEAKIKAQ